MNAHTKAEKQAYFKQLRERWTTAKQMLNEGKINEIQAIIATHGLKISNTGFMFVSIQMQRQHLDGLPYLDAKTYKGWRENGFQVRKGEKSTLSGITWISANTRTKTVEHKDDNTDKGGFVFPKEYHLFHRSQVDAA